jgi:hypothetical protein
VENASDVIYRNWNNKLDTLKRTNHTEKTQLTSNYTFYKRIVDRSQDEFDEEELEWLKLGLNYIFENPRISFVNKLILETEAAIEHLDIPVQNAYRILEHIGIKQYERWCINP